jgi:hypothetical protein
MAEEEKAVAPESTVQPDTRPRPAYDATVFDAYSNNSEIILGASEVSIAFLQDIGFNVTQKPIVRIVMTHAVFLNFVSFCNTRAKFLQDAYGGEIQHLGSTVRSQEEIEQSFEDMNSRKSVVARFEFDNPE